MEKSYVVGCVICPRQFYPNGNTRKCFNCNLYLCHWCRDFMKIKKFPTSRIKKCFKCRNNYSLVKDGPCTDQDAEWKDNTSSELFLSGTRRIETFCKIISAKNAKIEDLKKDNQFLLDKLKIYEDEDKVICEIGRRLIELNGSELEIVEEVKSIEFKDEAVESQLECEYSEVDSDCDEFVIIPENIEELWEEEALASGSETTRKSRKIQECVQMIKKLQLENEEFRRENKSLNEKNFVLSSGLADKLENLQDQVSRITSSDNAAMNNPLVMEIAFAVSTFLNEQSTLIGQNDQLKRMMNERFQVLENKLNSIERKVEGKMQSDDNEGEQLVDLEEEVDRVRTNYILLPNQHVGDRCIEAADCIPKLEFNEKKMIMGPKE